MSSRRRKPSFDGPEASGSSAVGAWEFDLRRRRLRWTDGVYDIFGLPRGQAFTREAILAHYHDVCRERMETLRAHAIREGTGFSMEARIWTESGAPRWMRLTAGVLMREGVAVKIFGTKQDITREHEALAELRQRADVDALTGLPNRAVFEAAWHDVSRGRTQRVAAFGMLDLDRFKQINDVYGHEAGDECLRVTAARLRHAFGSPVLIARYGGDEFAILWRGRQGRAVVAQHFAQAHAALSTPIFWDGQLIPVTVSIGVALEAASAPANLFRRADAALYRVKQAGRNAVHIE